MAAPPHRHPSSRGRSGGGLWLIFLLIAGILAAMAVAAPDARGDIYPAPTAETYEIVRAHRWGPIFFGETLRRARERGATVRFNPDTDPTWQDHGCGYATVRAEGRKMGSVMVWDVDGRVVVMRADFTLGYDRPVTTATGVPFGMTERRLLRRAENHGWNIEIEPHPYGEPGDHKITHRLRRDGRRYSYVYDTHMRDDRRVVTSIYAGKPRATRLIEGCV